MQGRIKNRALVLRPIIFTKLFSGDTSALMPDQASASPPLCQPKQELKLAQGLELEEKMAEICLESSLSRFGRLVQRTTCHLLVRMQVYVTHKTPFLETN